MLNSLFTFVTNLPKNVGDDVPAGKLKSLSYAPFRDGQDPMLEIFPNAKELDEDLELMGQVTHNIRTYASAEGTMPLIPDLAKKHGLTMLQGGWLGASKGNDEIKTAKLKAKNELETFIYNQMNSTGCKSNQYIKEMNESLSWLKNDKLTKHEIYARLNKLSVKKEQ